MKKMLIVMVLVLTAFGVIGINATLAQGQQPSENTKGAGLLHDYMVEALASALDLKVEDVEARLESGERMHEIALAEGVEQEELYDFMLEVRSEALEAAVADGVISQERADWMIQRTQRRNGAGTGSGVCPMGGAFSSNGSGMQHGWGMRASESGGFGTGMHWRGARP